jgi:hypothetical protein
MVKGAPWGQGWRERFIGNRWMGERVNQRISGILNAGSTSKRCRGADTVTVAPKLAYLALDRGPRARGYGSSMRYGSTSWLNQRTCVAADTLKSLFEIHNLPTDGADLEGPRRVMGYDCALDCRCRKGYFLPHISRTAMGTFPIGQHHFINGWR